MDSQCPIYILGCSHVRQYVVCIHNLKLEYLDYLVPLPVYCLQLVITFTLILYTCVDEVHDIVLSKIKSVNLYQCCNVVDVCPHHNDQDKLMVEWLMLMCLVLVNNNMVKSIKIIIWQEVLP